MNVLLLYNIFLTFFVFYCFILCHWRFLIIHSVFFLIIVFLFFTRLIWTTFLAFFLYFHPLFLLMITWRWVISLRFSFLFAIWRTIYTIFCNLIRYHHGVIIITLKNRLKLTTLAAICSEVQGLKVRFMMMERRSGRGLLVVYWSPTVNWVTSWSNLVTACVILIVWRYQPRWYYKGMITLISKLMSSVILI